MELQQPKVDGYCEHDKVYASYVLDSYPAQYPWICRLCGEQGTDRGNLIMESDYDALVGHFKSLLE